MILIKKLVTVNVLYYRPDYSSLLNSFTWQTNDMFPELPRVKKFLQHWEDNIDAKIHEVIIGNTSIRNWRKIDEEYFHGSPWTN
jgi:uncharacterized protein Usg